MSFFSPPRLQDVVVCCLLFVVITLDFPRAGIAGTIRLASVKCPSGLAFDLERQTCDWKAKVFFLTSIFIVNFCTSYLFTVHINYKQGVQESKSDVQTTKMH